jgi:hypothetical protein
MGEKTISTLLLRLKRRFVERKTKILTKINLQSTWSHTAVYCATFSEQFGARLKQTGARWRTERVNKMGVVCHSSTPTKRSNTGNTQNSTHKIARTQAIDLQIGFTEGGNYCISVAISRERSVAVLTASIKDARKPDCSNT